MAAELWNRSLNVMVHNYFANLVSIMYIAKILMSSDLPLKDSYSSSTKPITSTSVQTAQSKSKERRERDERSE